MDGRQSGKSDDWGDETEYKVRSRAGNAAADYHSDDYHGVNGIPRESNKVALAGCCFLLLLGCVYFYLGYKYALRQAEISVRAGRENLRVLKEVEERARTSTFEEQLERLLKRSNASDLRQKLDTTKADTK